MRIVKSRFLTMIHEKCTQGLYPLSEIQRFSVPKDKIPWNVEYQNYEPVNYTSPVIESKPWADPDINDPSFKPAWNSIDGNVNRKSFISDYDVDSHERPVNPIGRTGVVGRGLLGRWGPNHAADPIVTRWKRNGTGAMEIHRTSEKPILQFVAIQRRDSGMWAIPGGMVDPGETVSTTVKREFMEEALNALEKDDEAREELENSLKKIFSSGDKIYQGYVDDPRNTDNAWMETVAINFHDEDGSTLNGIALDAGDDATNVRWVTVDKQLDLYASHSKFIELMAKQRSAHW